MIDRGRAEAMGKKPIRQRPHRLSREDYYGEITAVFTICVSESQPLFHEHEVVKTFVDILRETTDKHDCWVIIYCFMPDHVHLILQGLSPKSDLWKAVVDFKQRSGYWLRQHRNQFHWQKGFFDHVIRKNDDLGSQIRYIAQNPVRKGLVKSWVEYPHTGSLGVDLELVINGLSEMYPQPSGCDMKRRLKPAATAVAPINVATPFKVRHEA
jgi:putative transposase